MPENNWSDKAQIFYNNYFSLNFSLSSFLLTKGKKEKKAINRKNIFLDNVGMFALVQFVTGSVECGDELIFSVRDQLRVTNRYVSLR